MAECFIGLPTDVFATPAHPAAELFPLMPDDELQALAEDIKKHGLREAIVVCLPDKPGGLAQIVDGRNRLRACQLAGVEPVFTAGPFGHDGGGVTEYVVSRNLFRRHLTGDQRREVIAALLRENPDQSDRRVAAQAQADHKTVGKVRDEMEGRGEIPHVPRRRDSKGRKQPARKATPSAEGEGDGPAGAGGRGPDPDNSPEDRKLKGKGIFMAHEAINILSRIPKDDALRQDGFRLVDDWITRHNLLGGGETVGQSALDPSKRWRNLAYCERLLRQLHEDTRRLRRTRVSDRKPDVAQRLIRRIQQTADWMKQDVFGGPDVS
jgi:hypothetical protein